MNREFRVFSLYGLPVSIVPGFFVGTGLTILALAAIGVLVIGLSLAPAFVAAIVATTLMWLSELIHQLGHAVAARRTGHPMIAVTLGRYLVLGTSVYPADEGALPPAVHVRRALGGPLASLIVSAVALPIAIALQPAGGAPFAVAAFIFVLNFFAYTLQVALPLRFNDGATLWRYLRR
jgi:Zn-dependent protease